ncbi:hypothetical protein KUTeg_004456 [Tegillarca granosa]|uniref:Calcium uniporter protein n=1 Tax=Tegillarca granosa TaxID=220873 RepID=A0ABQ9FUH9_TEGGR|nr:hypothetical protein KUTeg_004456 [Tegillarca granosa]
MCSYFCTSNVSYNQANVIYRDGLPVFIVPLPSRQENCEFTLKPITHTVGDFLKFLKEEDGGIDRSAIYSEDGTRISGSTTIDVLLRSNFIVSINEKQYPITPPEIGIKDSEHIAGLSDIKTLIAHLHSQLNSNKRTKILSWVGLGLMGFQFGFLARLTWWEYSWDIMEPVTYFVTYGTTMAMYAYFVITRQEYIFPDVKDREFLLSFYKGAKKCQLDVTKYNPA